MRYRALLIGLGALLFTACGERGGTTSEVISGPTTVASSTGGTSAPVSTDPASAEPVDINTGLPVVLGGDPANPAVGNQDASPANTPAVLGFAPDWATLLQKGNAEPLFQTCFEQRLGWDWPTVPEQNVQIEATLLAGRDTNGDGVVDQRSALRFIQASNTSLSDEEIRARLTAEGVEDVSFLAIVRYDGFVNTRGTHDGGCEAFVDMRSQVRVVLGSPVDVNDPWKGVDGTKGVVTSCGNPWTMLEKPPETPPTTTTTTIPGSTTTVKPPPTTAPPTPTTAPPTTAPGTTVPSATTTTTSTTSTTSTTTPATTTTVKPPYTTVAPSQSTIVPPMPPVIVTPPSTAAPDTVPQVDNQVDQPVPTVTVGNGNTGVTQPPQTDPPADPTNGPDHTAVVQPPSR